MEIKELKEYLEKRIQKYEKAAFTKTDGSSARAAAEDKAILRYIKSKEKKSVDYNKLQRQLDDALAKETKESWDEYLKKEHQVKYAGKTYVVVDEKELPGGIRMYGIEDEPGHVDYINADKCKEVEEVEEVEKFLLRLHDKYKDVRFSKLLDIACDVSKWQINDILKNAIECNVLWHDGMYLDYTQEQLEEALENIGADINDTVKVIFVKNE